MENTILLRLSGATISRVSLDDYRSFLPFTLMLSTFALFQSGPRGHCIHHPHFHEMRP
jgi:hypothetical protein